MSITIFIITQIKYFINNYYLLMLISLLMPSLRSAKREVIAITPPNITRYRIIAPPNFFNSFIIFITPCEHYIMNTSVRSIVNFKFR